MTDLLDHYFNTYEDFIAIGGFNEKETSQAMDLFLDKLKCKNIIKYKKFQVSCIGMAVYI